MPSHSEIIDKSSDENNQSHQTVRYQNSYRLESINPFKIEPMEKLVEEIVNENLENFSYDSKEAVRLCKITAKQLQKIIKSQKFDRYKIIVLVSIIEKASQSVNASMGFLWDSQKDTYINYTYEKPAFVAHCSVLAIYYE